MMIVKLKFQTLYILFLLAAFGLQACALPGATQTDVAKATSTPGEIPTWTPRAGEASTLPTATEPFDQTQDEPASVSTTEATPPTATESAITIPTPKTVTVTITGGNLNVRRGPSTAYNYVGVLYDGETTVAIGRDRISRWILIEIPSRPGVRGWATTETEYTDVEGDVSNLPFMTEQPAAPAFIRNCTKHRLRVSPTGVELLSKFDKPYNEDRFGVGTYQVYDLENPHIEAILEVSLSEGKTVDVLYDWMGEKSKCE